MNTTIVIPTYNERENMRILIPQIEKVFHQNGLSTDGKILVVDDNSMDGTAEVVNAFMKCYKNVFLLKRNEKGGLGSAYVAGFRYAMETLGTDIVFEMDGDGSHDPNDIKRFLAEIKNGYDVVVGSRYIKGGVIPKWTFSRRLMSRGGNFFARMIAGIPLHDCTSGYRAIKAERLEEIDLDALCVDGYVFQISLIHALLKKARIIEIPITFGERWCGESKLGNGDVREFFLTLFRLRKKSRREPDPHDAGY